MNVEHHDCKRNDSWDGILANIENIRGGRMPPEVVEKFTDRTNSDPGERSAIGNPFGQVIGFSTVKRATRGPCRFE